MHAITLDQIPTHLGWTFTHLLPGTFKRNRSKFMHLDYPILAPLPHDGRHQRPLNGAAVLGPFIYFVHDDLGQVYYVGKSQEEHILKRWIRPGNGGPAGHYWTHSTSTGGCTFKIAEGLRTGQGPFYLCFASLLSLRERVSDSLNVDWSADASAVLKHTEGAMIRALNPLWNSP